MLATGKDSTHQPPVRPCERAQRVSQPARCYRIVTDEGNQAVVPGVYSSSCFTDARPAGRSERSQGAPGR